MPIEMEVVVHAVKVFADGIQVEFAPPREPPKVVAGKTVHPMPVNEGMFLFIGGMDAAAKLLPRKQRPVLMPGPSNETPTVPMVDEVTGAPVMVDDEADEPYFQRVACSFAMERVPELVQVEEHQPNDGKPPERRVVPKPGTFTITIIADE